MGKSKKTSEKTGETESAKTQEEKRVAYREISEKLEQARNLIKECEGISEEFGIIFDFSVGYGMGGTFIPNEEVGDGQKGWVSSSQRC